MSISGLFLWFYRLPPVAITLSFLVCTAGFILIHRQLHRKLSWRSFLVVMLILWTYAALWVTILNRSSPSEQTCLLIPLHSYREVLAGGNREILRSNFMNMAMFYPAGLLLCGILPRRRRGVKVLVCALLFSLSIEVLQFHLSLGKAEIDDVIHNTLGAMLGCLAVSCGAKILLPQKRRDLP